MLLEATLPQRADIYDPDNLAAWHMPMEWDTQPAGTVGDAVRICRRLAATVNADSFSLLFAAVQGETRRLAPVFDSDFPGVSSLSRALSVSSAEGFARRAGDTTQPLWWRAEGDAAFLTHSAQCWAIEIDSPVAGISGIAFPVALERGRSGVVVFTGDALELDEARLCDLHARCFSLFEDVARQRVQERAKTPTVSKRELECLRLTADGMTSDDIASALGLSIHTANQYLTNSTHKLNAVNRIHAVAKALRSGLID